MLNVQEYLRQNGLERLKAEYNITACQHETEPLVILNYSQLDKTNKFHPIVRECRGLTLELDTWNLVARSFDRFYNYGEYPAEHNVFDWASSSAWEKIDGSLVLLYNYKGRWMANTRGSFGTGKVNDSEYTWQQLILRALQIDDFNQLNNKLNKNWTYICELVSPYNKIVHSYNGINLYHLSTFFGVTEFNTSGCNEMLYPKCYKFKSIEEVQAWLDEQSKLCPTFEGVVLKDAKGCRLKVKSLAYLGLHRIRGNGNEVSPKNVIHAIMQGNGPEMAGYFPEVQPMLDKLATAQTELFALADKYMGNPVQKDFALGVKHHPLSAILFNARKHKVHVSEEWEKSEDILLKFLEK